MSTAYEPGAPAKEGIIPLSIPQMTGNEWPYIKECLDTNWVSSVGSYVDRFEAMAAEHAGAKYAVATVNGTAALHIALLVAGVHPNDEVLVSDLTFIASANAIRYAGTWPIFIDAEEKYGQIDPALVRRFLEESCERRDDALYNKTTGRRVSAILPVDVLGHPVDMDPILDAAREFGLVVVEDGAEAIGATYKNRAVGNLADIGIFSFNGNKIITTGAGGMIVTDREDWAKKARHLTTQAKDDPLEYCHGEIGYNYRMCNILAAMGCAQMEQLDHFVATRRTIAAKYAEGLNDVPGLALMGQADWAESTFWLSVVLVDEAEYGMDSRSLLGKLREAGIQTRPLWQPMHQSGAHADAPRMDCPISERLNAQALSLPSSASLTPSQQDRVVKALRDIGNG